MKIYFYTLAASAVLFASCSQRGPQENIPLEYSDEVYSLVEAGDGETAQPGDFSVFSVLIKGDNGQVLLDRTAEENYGKYKIPADSTGFRNGSPVDEMLTYLVAGDSAVLVYTLDSLEKRNPALNGINSIAYEISVKEVISEEEMNNRNEEAKQKMEAKKAELSEKKEYVAKRLAEALEQFKNGSLGEALQSHSTGLQYLIETEGNGAKPTIGDVAKVHYYGIIESDGTMFDNSYQRGEFFTFPVGQGRVIQGWDIALQLMPKGTEAIFFIPYELAYGAAGNPPSIPAESNLVFYIEYPE
jgi:FKBP-type peptidyl-prolyl cis-trans isomerase FkpA